MVIVTDRTGVYKTKRGFSFFLTVPNKREFELFETRNTYAS